MTTVDSHLVLGKSKEKSTQDIQNSIPRIYGIETDCDVALLTDDKWRLPVHSGVLRERNIVFNRMFAEEFFNRAETKQENESGLYCFEIKEVDGHSLDNLLRCLYNTPVSVQSVETALPTLYAGHLYQCPELVSLCVSYLSLNLRDTNVLTVLRFANVLSVNYQNLQNVQVEKCSGDTSERESSRNRAKSNKRSRQKAKKLQIARDRIASELHTIENLELRASAPLLGASELDSIESYCSDLFKKCLDVIDENADKILESDEFEQLNLETLTLILSRDSLNVQNEGKVFDALLKWAEQQCKQQQLYLTPKNKREVLMDSLFLPRYSVMKLEDFQQGPLQSGLFAPKEIDILQGLITGRFKLTDITAPDAPNFQFWSTPRQPMTSTITNGGTKTSSQRSNHDRRRLFSQCRFFSRFCHFQNPKCCKKNSGSSDSTPTSSYPTSPTRSVPSSPFHLLNEEGPIRNPENPQRWNRRGSQIARVNFLEQIVVCFACMFD